MFKRHRPDTGTGDYSRLEQHDEEDEAYYSEQTFHHPNSVLVANHHGHCNVVPLLSQNMPVTSTTPHHSPPHSPRASFSAATHVTRRFFQTKLPIVFRKDMASTASFSSLPPVLIADLQNGNIPEIAQQDESGSKNDQGWTIIHKRRFRGKHGIGESRHPNSSSTSAIEVMIDEEIDPSDQVTCSVFVKWLSEGEPGEQQQPQPYTMTMSPLFANKEDQQAEQQDVRYFQDPIPETEERFKEIVQSVRTAIENNMQPTRISQGSSGSYFCRNSSGKIVGVFKPKNEEPYGRLNPKWTKWIHRHLFPCFFGRSCLIPNLGYLSEAAASLIDRKLGTMVVPYTDVIHMSSPSFHYDYLDRRSQHGLPPKIGSFQCFLTDYKDATVFFRDYPYHDYEYAESRAMSRSSVWAGCLGRNDDLDEDNTVLYNMNHQLQQEEDDSDHTQVATTPLPSTPTTTTTYHTYPHDTTPQNKSSKKPHKKTTNHEFRWTHQLQKQFRREFEQLVILDYLIRNTDRGLDNWMIKYCPPKAPKSNHHHHHNPPPSSSSSSSSSSCSSQCPNDHDQINKQASSKQQPQPQPQEVKGHIHVAAIDNGLAFPYKHPDQWRSYPYGWIAMPDALVNRPFSEATRKQFLPILSDPLWWRDTVREMRALFELDDDFDEKMFQKQMAVLKGQGYNIIRTLKDPAAGPIDLVAMQRVVINQEEVLIEYDDRILQSRGLHLQTPASNPPTSSSAMDISDALPANSTKSQRLRGSRRLRTQRSTSFDVISTTSSPFYDDDEEEEEEDLDLEAGYFPPMSSTAATATARRERKWKDKLKDGLSMDLGGAERSIAMVIFQTTTTPIRLTRRKKSKSPSELLLSWKPLTL
ncbi:unnamed protein product [Mucor fragilis]